MQNIINLKNDLSEHKSNQLKNNKQIGYTIHDIKTNKLNVNKQIKTIQTKFNEISIQNQQLLNDKNDCNKQIEILNNKLNKHMLMNTQLNNDLNELNENLNGFKMYEAKQNAKHNQLIENEKLMKNKLGELGDKYNEMELDKRK